MADQAFNPDQYLKEKASVTAFDPDAYLKQKTGQAAPEESPLKRMARSTIDTVVPAATGLGAAALATPESLGVGTLPAGALGYAAGKQLARLLNHYVLGDPMESKGLGGATARTADDIKNGAMYEMGGQSIGAIPGLVKEGAGAANSFVKNQLGKGVEFTPAANAPQVQKAAQALNLSVPKAVLTDNPAFQDLESGLSQSGSFPAKEVSGQYSKFFKGLDKAADKIEQLKTPQSDYAIGSSVKNDLAGEVNKMRAPVSELYNDLTPHLQKIPVDQPSVNRVFGALKRNPLFQTQDGKGMLEEFKSIANTQPELNSLKEWRSSIGDSLGPSSSPLDAKRIDALQSAVTSVRDNSISAMKNQLPKSMHPEVDNLIDQVALADKAHQSNLEDLNSIKSLLGNKDIKSPVTFLNKLGDMKESDVAQRAANLDVTSMGNLKEKFPSIFDKAQAAKINDMVQGSTNPVSGFNVNRFMKQYDGMDQEMKDLIFNKDLQTHITNLQTVKQAIPPQLGPSGTPKGEMIMDMFNPKRNALDLGIKKVLDTSSSANVPSLPQSLPADATLAAKVGNVSTPPRLLEMARPASATPVMPASVPAAADNKAPTKGPDKWANDGLQNLMNHSGGIDQATLDKAKGSMNDDPKVKDLLIKASDLKPGSKALENILSQLKSKLAQGED